MKVGKVVDRYAQARARKQVLGPECNRDARGSHAPSLLPDDASWKSLLLLPSRTAIVCSCHCDGDEEQFLAPGPRVVSFCVSEPVRGHGKRTCRMSSRNSETCAPPTASAFRRHEGRDNGDANHGDAPPNHGRAADDHCLVNSLRRCAAGDELERNRQDCCG